MSKRLGRYVFAALWPVIVIGGLYLVDAPVWVTVLFGAASMAGAVQLVRTPPRTAARPVLPLEPESCPRCGAPIRDERDTSSGRAMYTYSCTRSCGWFDIRDEGIALWKAMSREPDD